MTATQFAARVTEIIDAATGGAFDYPTSFEIDCCRLMAAQLSAEDAAEKIMDDAA